MKSERTWQQRASVFLGILLVVATISGAVLPLLQNTLTQQQPQISPTDTPVPTVPAPPDTSLINFDQSYFHPSGLFTAAIPSGWAVTSELNTTGEALVTLQNPTALSVVEVRVIRPTADILLDSPQNMGAYFTQAWLDSSWRQYTSKQEDQRRVEGNQLIMDFTLTQRGQTYSARQISYTDGTWIYAVRVVTPANATEALQYVLEGEVASLKPVERFVGAPLDWYAYFDNINKMIIRFPSTWAITDSADAAPASILGTNALMRVETAALGIASADAASAYISGLRTGTTVLSVEEIEQYGLPAYRVAYTIPSIDGPSQSGIALILNAGSNNHVANILLTDLADTDLNAVDLAALGVAQNILDARAVLDTFSLLPEITVTQ